MNPRSPPASPPLPSPPPPPHLDPVQRAREEEVRPTTLRKKSPSSTRPFLQLSFFFICLSSSSSLFQLDPDRRFFLPSFLPPSPSPFHPSFSRRHAHPFNHPHPSTPLLSSSSPTTLYRERRRGNVRWWIKGRRGDSEELTFFAPTPKPPLRHNKFGVTSSPPPSPLPPSISKLSSSSSFRMGEEL